MISDHVIDSYSDCVRDVIPSSGSIAARMSAFWKLGEAGGAQRNDSIGSRHLSDNGTVPQSVGHLGNCAGEFDGTADYLSLASIGDIDPGGPFCVQGWIYANTWTGENIVLGVYNGGAPSAWMLTVNQATGAVTFYCNVQNNTNNDASLDSWFHFAAGFDGDANESFLYINGGTATVRATTAPQTVAADFVIGGTHGAADFQGKVDAIGWMVVGQANVDWVRSGGGLAQLYNGGTGWEPS